MDVAQELAHTAFAAHTWHIALDARKEAVMGDKGHYWRECQECGWMVVCGTCGNNCCSGGHGTLDDGEECPDCESAYEMQKLEIASEARTISGKVRPLLQYGL